jgi:uncharacterized OsmC-like protein
MSHTSTATRRNGIDVALLEALAGEITASAAPVTLEVRTQHRWESAAAVDSRGASIAAFGETVDRSHHVLRTDLPVPLGGRDTAPAPTEVLLTALTGCVVSALTEQAAIEGVGLHDVHVTASTSLDARGAFGVDGARIALEPITLTITVDADAEPEQVEALCHSSLSTSPTAATITQPVPVRLEVRSA